MFIMQTTYIVCMSFLLHVSHRVGVDHLITERTARKVRSLGDVENLVNRGLGKDTWLGRPEFAKDSEQRRLSTAIGSRNEQVHARFYRKVHLADQFVAVRAINWDVFEDDVISMYDFGTFSWLLKIFRSRTLVFSSTWDFWGDNDSLVLALAQIWEHLVHLIDQSGVACQILHLLVRDNQSADGFCQIDQQRRVAHVVLSDLSLIVSKFGEIFLAIGSKDGETDDCVANHDSTVLDQHRVVNAHQESLLEDEADVRVKFVEAVIDVALFPVLSIVESDFFWMSEQIAVKSAILTLKTLLLGCQSTEWRRNEPDNETREGIPTECESWSLPAYQLRELSWKQDHI